MKTLRLLTAFAGLALLAEGKRPPLPSHTFLNMHVACSKLGCPMPTKPHWHKEWGPRVFLDGPVLP